MAQRVTATYDASTLLDRFSQQVFGRLYVFTDTAGKAVAVSSVGLPREYERLLQQQVRAAGSFAWGGMTEGAMIVLGAVGHRPSQDAAADIAAAGLGAVVLGGFGPPGDAAEALALVDGAAPGLHTLNWQLQSAGGGRYIFAAEGPKTFSTSRGSVTASVVASATVWSDDRGETSVAVLAGSGDAADLVR